LADLIVRVLSAGNPSWVQNVMPTDDICKPRRSQLERLRIEVKWYLCLTSLICLCRNNWCPPWGTK